MKITFIKPNIGRQEHSLYVDEGRMEPLMLGVLAGMTPPDVECALFDDRCERVNYDDPTDCVAITVETYTARRAYEIAAEFRRRGVKVILGGMHVSLAPEEASLHADAIFLGDAETLWTTVVDDLRYNRLKKRYQAPPGPAQIGGTLPRRDLFRGKGYLPIALMQYTRGCHFPCRFCAVSEYFDKKVYLRRIDEVLKELDAQDGKFVFFVDDNIAADRRALREFCHALIPMKINWVSQASLDVTQDRDLVALMSKAGCRGNIMGFESISPSSLKEALKSPNLKRSLRYQEEVKTLRDFGMQTWAAFTLGYDGDTYDSVMATMDFALKNRFTFAAFNILMPYPGTPFYDTLAAEGRHLFDGRWWLHPQYRFNEAAFIPKQMTPEQLTEVCHRIRKMFNSVPSLLYRFSDLKTNLRSLWRIGTYWRYTPLFRKEMYKKHGMRFGLQ